MLINTMRDFQKARNLQARAHATVLVVEPGDTQIRPSSTGRPAHTHARVPD